jgi:hypothetical protein
LLDVVRIVTKVARYVLPGLIECLADCLQGIRPERCTIEEPASFHCVLLPVPHPHAAQVSNIAHRPDGTQ